jgi:hypothetical protein
MPAKAVQVSEGSTSRLEQLNAPPMSTKAAKSQRNAASSQKKQLNAIGMQHKSAKCISMRRKQLKETQAC